MNETELTDYIIRHGQTENSKSAQIQSWNERLNEIGVHQIQLTAIELTTMPEQLPLHIISGTQVRQLESAEILQQVIRQRMGIILDITLTGSFVERQYPEHYKGRQFWGLPRANSLVKELEEKMKQAANDPNWPLELGENDWHLLERAKRAKEIREKQPYSTIIVTSGGITKAYLATLLNNQNPMPVFEALKTWDLFNGSITTIKGNKNKNWHPSSWNSINHFKQFPELIT